MENKKKVNEEISNLVKNLKENCFPRPSGKGCRCVEKNATNHEIEKIYQTDSECKISSRKRRGNVNSHIDNNQNVRDPIREQAQKNYAAVVKELNEKFSGLKAGCFPRPKGKVYFYRNVFKKEP